MIKNIDAYQIDEDAFNLRDLMDASLATLVAVYEKYNMPLPSRRYWTFARPAEDCEQAVVTFMNLYLGAPGDQANAPQHCRVAPRSAVLEITVTREYPIGNNGYAIDAKDLQEASEWSALDAWILIESAAAFDAWGGIGVIATVSSNEPSGGIQTTILNLTVAIP